jgi:Skp family chaperone for outer membrane proteins
MGAMAFSTGCKDDQKSGGGGGSSSSSNGATAVVDLQKVFRELGWLTKLQANSETYQTQLKADFGQFQKRYNDQLQAHLKDMVPPGVHEGEKYTLTQTQSQELANWVYAERQQEQGLGTQAQQVFNAYQQQWIRQYRDALSPIVREVAQDKRMNVVIAQTDQLLYTDRTVDLTDAVVDAARKQPPTLTEVPMQHLQGAPDIRPQQAPPPLTQPSTQPAPATQP